MKFKFTILSRSSPNFSTEANVLADSFNVVWLSGYNGGFCEEALAEIVFKEVIDCTVIVGPEDVPGDISL